MKVVAIDHIVLTVNDIDATCVFYVQVLGLSIATFGSGRKALLCGRQKINLHQYGNEFEPRAKNPTPGSADLCFITGLPVLKIIAHLGASGVEIVEGPVRRTGAAGAILSVYFRDPDGNLVEVATYEDA